MLADDDYDDEDNDELAVFRADAGQTFEETVAEVPGLQ